MFRARLLLGGALGLALTLTAWGASDNCPAVNAITNFQIADSGVNITAYGTANTATGVVTYFFEGEDFSTQSIGGIPGLITYCVYPQAGANPDGPIVAMAVGADGEPFVAQETKGSFSYSRAKGDPSNVPLDGTKDTMGTAQWIKGCLTDPFTGATDCTAAIPNYTIVLHINDAAECQALYGGTSSTCFVLPNNGGACEVGNPVCTPPVCNGDPACKSAAITDSNGSGVELGTTDCIVGGVNYGSCPIVPMFTQLLIDYTYTIVNQPGTGYTMDFLPYTSKTQDINTGGGKDYFGCEQTPNPAGTPGGKFPQTYSYAGVPFTFYFQLANGTCPQSRFFGYIPQGGTKYSLAPGNQLSWEVDMETHTNKSGKFEYTSCGPHLLNSGFTIKWFQSNDTPLDSIQHSFSTSINPLYVYAATGVDINGNPTCN